MELDFSGTVDRKVNKDLSQTEMSSIVPQSKATQTFMKAPVKVNKVLLLFPSAYTIKSSRDINPLPPIGIGMLASILEKKKYEVKILDCLVRGWDQEEKTQTNKDIVRVGLTNNQIKKLIYSYRSNILFNL